MARRRRQSFKTPEGRIEFLAKLAADEAQDPDVRIKAVERLQRWHEKETAALPREYDFSRKTPAEMRELCQEALRRLRCIGVRAESTAAASEADHAP